MNYREVPLEVLRDLWFVRFGSVATYEDAHNAVRAGEDHWNAVYIRLANAGWISMVHAPLRIVVTEEVK